MLYEKSFRKWMLLMSMQHIWMLFKSGIYLGYDKREVETQSNYWSANIITQVYVLWAIQHTCAVEDIQWIRNLLLNVIFALALYRTLKTDRYNLFNLIRSTAYLRTLGLVWALLFIVKSKRIQTLQLIKKLFASPSEQQNSYWFWAWPSSYYLVPGPQVSLTRFLICHQPKYQGITRGNCHFWKKTHTQINRIA